LAIGLLSILELGHSKACVTSESSEERQVVPDAVKRPVPLHPVVRRILHGVGHPLLEKCRQENCALRPEEAPEFAEVDADRIRHHVRKNGVKIDDVKAFVIEWEPERTTKRRAARVVAAVPSIDKPELETRVSPLDVELTPPDRPRLNIHATISPDVPNLIQNPDWQTAYATADIQHCARRAQSAATNQTLGLRLGGSKKEIVVLEFLSSEAQVLRRDYRRSADSVVRRYLIVYVRKNAS